MASGFAAPSPVNGEIIAQQPDRPIDHQMVVELLSDEILKYPFCKDKGLNLIGATTIAFINNDRFLIWVVYFNATPRIYWNYAIYIATHCACDIKRGSPFQTIPFKYFTSIWHVTRNGLTFYRFLK